ncbi:MULTISPECIES: polysaccharide pyruvyl transferase CsaB [Aneurinibacillus]|uniref:Polysaccharide pyruvyl transferase CsaB n=1 Tax=Aneurinibacillus thermoaerophilus TaxID=143495 RepID=A0A1G8D700_ANETH|nr:MULTISPECIES: polysaccharide pyruvyl transferase CsaB [Aneurinibacillus]AMA72039.1 polysaccharide pyruvyl transferase CsaB [Aneurinibacillus sp. XH2]MED0676998.1 polysaccharide pyruvyl transferase CsaB [Aneurinibacillus thermoaerophilus]MED0679323.1 polysaccharide pyruvyl transferase CsaB [Aneurinibacillus thermoaerophilus]MED0737209.1 polysaccharide pyruvyl transferase CsaB [Aneurinibacillus thermoaerophilus]MED0757255.1 polysaccharide pyruvyl transferase CsaB [Aneurinibacillus thermoaerop
MARILISGYYGFDNAGDDTVLYGIITSLTKHMPDAQLAVLSNTPAETQALFGIPAFNRWRMSAIIQQLKKSDLLVMGGGSLLQDATSPRSVIYYLGIVMMAKMLGKPVIFYAQGIGPITRAISKRLIRAIVNRVDVITVRDEQSGEDLKSFGVVKAPIYVTADPAVTINPSQVDTSFGQNIIKKYKPGTTKPVMAISVRAWKNEQQYKTAIARFADEALRRGWEVFFLPMQNPADLAPSADIIRLMEEPGAVLIEEKMNFKQIFSFIGASQFVLGMRLHSVILAAVMNIPFAGISYDPKMDRFVQRLGMESAGHIKGLEYETLLANVEPLLNDLTGTQEKIRRNIGALIQEAEKSSLLAVELLKRRHK